MARLSTRKFRPSAKSKTAAGLFARLGLSSDKGENLVESIRTGLAVGIVAVLPC